MRILLLALGLWALLGTAAWSEEASLYQALGLEFQVPVPLSGPENFGLMAVRFCHPAGADPNGFEIVVHAISTDSQERMRQAGVDPVTNEKGVFLGLVDPPDGHRTRTIMGRQVKGELYKVTVPRPGKVEVYAFPLANGTLIMLAFRYPQSFPAEEAERLMEAVTGSLREAQAPSAP